MITASPITRQTVGRTFIVAIILLGAIAAIQLSLVVSAFVSRPGSAPSLAVNEPPASAEPITGSVRSGMHPIPEEDAFTETPLVNPAAPAEAPVAPRPTPLAAKAPTLPEPEQSARFKEAVAQGKLLRERGDMSTALTRFREAAAMDAKSPEALFEIALTYEKMQLGDRAAEQWRRVYDMGEAAGPYYTAAEARLAQVKERTMREAMRELPQTVSADAETGISAGKVLGLNGVTVQEQEDRGAAKHLALKIPIKARAREQIDVRQLTVQVLFYDSVDNQTLVQTTADVSSRWISAPADWADSDTETLEVDYRLPLPDPRASRREKRSYFGYLIRLYYKGELQASDGEPERLVQQFPPEPKLGADTSAN